MKKSLVLLAIGAALSVSAADRGFLRRGDVWVMSGDSITFIGLCQQTVEDAIAHFHPDGGIRVCNVGVWGQLAQEARGKGLELKPTVVTIMLGMNNVIHRDYPATFDFAPGAAKYAETIRRQVRDYRKAGAEVVLMKPTLTDETENSYFSPFHTREGLVVYGEALAKMAAEEKCAVLPIAEDFERFKPKAGALETLIPDGVHPYGWGQYAIARALVHHFKIAAPLAKADEVRALELRPVELNDIVFRRATAFLAAAADAPAVEIVAPRTMQAHLCWSVEASDARGEEDVVLEKGKPSVFTPKIPSAALPARLGRIGRVILSVTPADGRPRLAVVDLARTRVVRMTDGRASGEIRTDEPREEGPLVGTWTMEERGTDLWFSGRMTAKSWPKRLSGAAECWMNSGSMNGVMAIFDFRPSDRFAENRFDHDVNMIDLSVLEDPWSVLPLAWVNRRIQSCLLADAERTEDGYAWRMGFRGFVTDYHKFDITKLDRFGVYFLFDDDENGKMGRYPVFKQLYGKDDAFVATPERRLNQLVIFDRKGTVPADANGETTTVGVFGL